VKSMAKFTTPDTTRGWVSRIGVTLAFAGCTGMWGLTIGGHREWFVPALIATITVTAIGRHLTEEIDNG